jgi:uncharacterized protein (DUF608 family)
LNITNDADFHGRIFTGPDLLQIAMPMGGIGAGCICLTGEGSLQDFSLRNRPATSAGPDGHGFTPAAFGLLHIRGESPLTRLIEGPMPVEKVYNQGLMAQGFRRGGYEGMPRFGSASFTGRYPFGRVSLEDPGVPLKVAITGWSPLIPRDDVDSGIPCALLEYTFENTTDAAVTFEFSYHLSHLSPTSATIATRNEVISDASGGGVYFSNNADPNSEEWGNAALVAVGRHPRIKAMWFRGGWFDALSVLWREASTGTFRENDGTGAESLEGRNGGSLLIEGTLEPGETVTYPVVLAWHFPNSNQRYGEAPKQANGLTMAADCGPDCACEPATPPPAWRPFYAGIWKDAREVARYVAERYDSLRARTLAFTDALWSSTLPLEARDAIASNLAILKSPTVLRQENGNVWAWEGCFAQSGCYHGSCTHVWNYAQALPHLFPRLERTLREQELERSMDGRGHIQFRAALPDGPTTHGYHAASDGQFGGVMKVFRDWQISGDREWLARLYPCVRRSVDYGIATWDPDRRGGLFEPHHNTYDIEFWGPDGMCGSIYIGALSAMAEMARALGNDADGDAYADLAQRGAAFMASELFNGEYYQHNIQWEGLRDTSFAEQMSGVTDASNEMLRLQKAEGPKYQYGTGCISDGVIGAWMASIYGIRTPLDREQVRSTLRAIFAHNFKPDLSEHACLQRPGYAMGKEPGLLLCTWPRGGKPTLPFVYSDEVWTGIEYQVASHLIEEGYVEEGLTVVRAARSRYDGHVRNPFNEYECGSYYARALASYALLGSLTGFRYSAASRTLWFGPRTETGGEFRAFFSAADGYGTITLNADRSELTVAVLEGQLEVERLLLTVEGTQREVAGSVAATPDKPGVWRL